MLGRFNLKGKIVLLAGGAGFYGRGLTSDLASSGATLVIASRSRVANEAVAAEEVRSGHTIVPEVLDQSSEESVVGLKDRIIGRFGRLDGLVNNVVARPMTGPNGALTDWEQSLAVNATGLFLMHRHFGQTMCEQRSGSIVNIGSIQGLVGPTLELYQETGVAAGAPDYFFHKAGMINLTRYYAAHFGPSGVRVNCLSPGGFLSGQPEEFVRKYSAQTFLQRMADDQDLGGAVVFLLSDASSYVTGTNIPIDGGYSAH